LVDNVLDLLLWLFILLALCAVDGILAALVAIRQMGLG